MRIILVIKILIIGVLINLFSGCATSVKYQISSVKQINKLSGNNISFNLIDSRNPTDKKAEIMSLSISDCWYGIYRLGDQQILPDRISILSNELEKYFGSRLRDKNISVIKFEIFNNIQSSLRSGASAPYGAIGDLFNSLSCESVLDNKKNPNNKPSVIVYLELDIDGYRVKKKTVQIVPEGTDFFGNKIQTERIKNAVYNSIKNVIAIYEKSF